MAEFTKTKLAIAVVGGLSLAACGGGGERPNSTPTPLTPPPPPPPPPPLEAPPIPDGAVGLQSDEPFATHAAWMDSSAALSADSESVAISYSAGDGSYTLTLPGREPGQLNALSGDGSYDETGWVNLTGTYSELLTGSGTPADVGVSLQWPAASAFTHTNFGGWEPGCVMVPCEEGMFAYGIPTAASAMPVTGSASYEGDIRGMTDQAGYVWGSVSLDFDFAAGTLGGYMEPMIADSWDSYSLGTYTFRDTVYSSGSTTFSGGFIVPGGADGLASFSGSFTGPSASELMAHWQAPYLDPQSGHPGTMVGVWIARAGD